MIDVMMSVDVGSVVPVYGSQRGPESDAAMIRESNNQNLRFVDGRFIVGPVPEVRGFWTATGCVHAFYEVQGGRVRWLETSAPGPPPRHSYRFERDWDYLAAGLRSEVGAA